MLTFGYKMNFHGCYCGAVDFKTLMLQKKEPQGIAGEAAQSHNLLTTPPLPSSPLLLSPGRVRGGGGRSWASGPATVLLGWRRGGEAHGGTETYKKVRGLCSKSRAAAAAAAAAATSRGVPPRPNTPNHLFFFSLPQQS